jgi:hypothetical protein
VSFIKGSWTVVDPGLYVLQDCPKGHKIINSSTADDNVFSHDAQTCQPCGKGEECTHSSSCVTCSKCQPGYYKAAVSTDPCLPCPANTFREEAGASDLGMCRSCLAKSSTRGAVGQSTWQACVCDSSYYLIMANSADDACQDCPPGLTCHGDATLDPVVPGSNWTIDGAIFRLQSCPTGYFVSPRASETFDAAQQRCLPCGKGEECTHSSSCVTCSECQPGYYKAAVSTDPCLPCPANTFNPDPGATSITFCKACPIGADTGSNTAKVSLHDCACSVRLYSTTSTPFSCSTCPSGAVCLVSVSSLIVITQRRCGH